MGRLIGRTVQKVMYERGPVESRVFSNDGKTSFCNLPMRRRWRDLVVANHSKSRVIYKAKFTLHGGRQEGGVKELKVRIYYVVGHVLHCAYAYAYACASYAS